LFGLVALLIRLDSRGPTFFRQPRIGANGRPFQIWKFRTMIADADERKAEVAHLNVNRAPGGDPRMFKILDDPRVTRVGRMLRRCSIDEFPQLINVVRGEMSLVGPRPLIPDEHRFVTDWAERRLLLRPGMTGLWQVLGRSEIPFEEMVRLDCVYVNTWSLWSDLRLIARTVPAMVSGNGRH
jgi:lipopolysaccharide/colanic/teichoic acid biosynthesis glycosyltransferase